MLRSNSPILLWENHVMNPEEEKGRAVVGRIRVVRVT